MISWLENAMHDFFLNQSNHSYASRVFTDVCRVGWNGRAIGVSKYTHPYSVSKAGYEYKALLFSRKITNLRLVVRMLGCVLNFTTLKPSNMQSGDNKAECRAKFTMMSPIRNELIDQFPVYVKNIDEIFNNNAYSFDVYREGLGDIPQKLIVLWGNNVKGMDQLSSRLGHLLVDDEKWFRSINGEWLLSGGKEEAVKKFRGLFGKKTKGDGVVETTLPFRVVRIVDFDRCMINRNDEYDEIVKVLREELQLFLVYKNYCIDQNVLVIATTRENMARFPSDIVKQGVLGYWSEMSFPQEQRKRDLIEFYLSDSLGDHVFDAVVLEWLTNILGEISSDEIALFCKKLALNPEYKNAVSASLLKDDQCRQKRILRNMISDPMLVIERRRQAAAHLKCDIPYIELTSFKKRVEEAVRFLESLSEHSGQLACLIVSGDGGSGRTAFCYQMMENLTSFDGFFSVNLFDVNRFKINRYCSRSLAVLEAAYNCSAVNSLVVFDDADSLSCLDVQMTFDDIKPLELKNAWKSLQDRHNSGKNIVLVLVVRSENLQALQNTFSGTHISYLVELDSHLSDSDIDKILGVKGVQSEARKMIKEALFGYVLSCKAFMRLMHRCIRKDGTVDMKTFQRECGLNSLVERPELSMFS